MADLVEREGARVHTTRYMPEDIAKLFEGYHQRDLKGKLVLSCE